MKVSKLMMKLAEKRDESLLIAQKCQEAIDELSAIVINEGDKDVDSDIYYIRIYPSHES